MVSPLDRENTGGPWLGVGCLGNIVAGDCGRFAGVEACSFCRFWGLGSSGSEL